MGVGRTRMRRCLRGARLRSRDADGYLPMNTSGNGSVSCCQISTTLAVKYHASQNAQEEPGWEMRAEESEEELTLSPRGSQGQCRPHRPASAPAL